LKWVSSMALMMHPTIQKSMPLPGPDTEDQQKARTNVFHRLRNPKTKPDVSVTNENMPLIWSDRYIGDDPKNPLDLSAALTEIQYHILKQWKEGKFKNDWNNSANTKSVSVTEITPKGLTRAALESCVGGNFYPGIEMAVPWQADFYDCGYDLPKNAVVTGRFWWPAHRPEDVFPESGGPQVSWIRKDDHIDTPEDFVRNWYKFGFVIQKDDQYVESQREP
jgi:hypothetical protein